MPFESCRPVREFPSSYKGQRHLSGRWWTATTGTLVGYESWVERDTLIVLDFDPDVVGIASQPFWLFWTAEALGIERTRTSKEVAQLALTHWFRPHPQPSRYLALAIEPVPGPSEKAATARRPAARPMSDTEKRLMAMSPVLTNPLRSNLAPLLDE